MLDITNIPPPRVPLVDERTGLMSREWYRFFLSLFRLTGSGSNDISLEDLQLGPDQHAIQGEISKAISEAQLSGPSSAELGTLASQNADNVRLIGFSTVPSPTVPNPAPTGTLYWDGNSTLGLQMNQNVLARVGQGQFVYVKASAAITKGQVCYHTGAVGGSGVVTAAPTPINLTDPIQIIGVAAETIALNGFGFVQISGDIKGFDTTGTSVGEVWADGDSLYYNPSFVGSMTKVKPSAPSIKTLIGEVINASAGGSGSINIRLVYGSTLGGTDSNVQITGVTNGNLLQYDSALGYWKNITTLGTGSGGTGLTSFTNKGVVYASSTTTLTTGSGLSFDGTNFGVGTASPAALINGYSTTSAQILLQGDGVAASVVPARYSTNSLAASVQIRKYRGSVASPTAVASGDLLGTLSYAAYGGTTVRALSSIAAGVTTYTSDTDISSYLSFGTSGSGSASATERMQITSSGNIYGTSGTTSMTDGFFYIPAAGGAPTGVPTAISGRVPMYYDTTNNKFYVYNGAWKSVTLT